MGSDSWCEFQLTSKRVNTAISGFALELFVFPAQSLLLRCNELLFGLSLWFRPKNL